MSFLTDLYHGNFSNLGNDLTHAPSSFINHPTEMLEAGGLALGAALPFALPEIGAAAGGLGGLFGFGGDASAIAAGEAAGGDALAFTGEAAGADAAGSGQSAISSLLAGTGDSGLPASATSSMGTFGDVGLGTPGNVGFDTSGLAGGGTQDVTALAGNDVAASSTSTDAEPFSAAGTGGKGAGPTSFMDTLTSGIANAPGNAVDSLAKNPLGIAAAGTGLALNMLNNKPNPNIANLQGQANQLTAQGQQFMSFLQNGSLPPALKASVDQAANAAKAHIIANHAANGQSTDPSQNSALAQELAAADQNALVAVGQLGEQLFTAGQSEIGLSSQIYQKLIAIDQQQSASQGKAIASFAAALGSGASSGRSTTTTVQNG